MSKDRFYRNSFLMSGVIFISRIFGFLRDVILAAFFGTSSISDAYFIAYRIPNTLRALLGEGAFNSAFIPIYSEYTEADDRKKEGYFLGNLFIRFSLVLFVVSFLGMFFSRQIILLISIGNPEATTFIFTASRLLRITFWYLFFVGLSAFFMGIQQANNSFARSAAGQIVYNISFILFLLLLFKVKDQTKQVYIAAYGVLVAGFLQLLYQSISAIRLKRPFILNTKKELSSIKKLIKIVTPAVFGQAIIEINLLADSVFALFISTGVISAMYYASRLMQLPLGIFSVSIATVSLALFSKRIAKGKTITEEVNRSIDSISDIILPISSFLIGGGIYLIKVLFMRGNFTEQSAKITGFLLIFYAMGLIFYSFVKLFAQIFYAHKLIKYPVIFTSVAMLINIELNMILIKYLGAGGLALASAISSMLNFLMLFYYTKKKFELEVSFRKTLRILPITIITSILLIILRPHIEGLIAIKIELVKNLILVAVFFILNLIPYIALKLILGEKIKINK